MNFRWTALIALWTLLIGPVANSVPRGMTRPPRIVVIRYVAPTPPPPPVPEAP